MPQESRVGGEALWVLGGDHREAVALGEEHIEEAEAGADVGGSRTTDRLQELHHRVVARASELERGADPTGHLGPGGVGRAGGEVAVVLDGRKVSAVMAGASVMSSASMPTSKGAFHARGTSKLVTIGILAQPGTVHRDPSEAQPCSHDAKWPFCGIAKRRETLRLLGVCTRDGCPCPDVRIIRHEARHVKWLHRPIFGADISPPIAAGNGRLQNSLEFPRTG